MKNAKNLYYKQEHSVSSEVAFMVVLFGPQTPVKGFAPKRFLAGPLEKKNIFAC